MKTKEKTYWIRKTMKSGKALWVKLPGKKEYEEAKASGEEVKIEITETKFTFRW